MGRVAFNKIAWNRSEDRASWRHAPSADPPAETDGVRLEVEHIHMFGMEEKRSIGS